MVETIETPLHLYRVASAKESELYIVATSIEHAVGLWRRQCKACFVAAADWVPEPDVAEQVRRNVLVVLPNGVLPKSQA